MNAQTFENDVVLKIMLSKNKFIDVVILLGDKKICDVVGRDETNAMGAFSPVYQWGKNCKSCKATKADCHFADKDKNRFGIVYLEKESAKDINAPVHEFMHVTIHWFAEKYRHDKNIWKKIVKDQEEQCYFMQNLVSKFMLAMVNNPKMLATLKQDLIKYKL